MGKRWKQALFLLAFLMMAGCSNIEDSVSKDEAKELVLQQHKHPDSKAEIVSIDLKDNAYLVQWANKENKEWGTDQVTKDRKVKSIEYAIE